MTVRWPTAHGAWSTSLASGNDSEPQPPAGLRQQVIAWVKAVRANELRSGRRIQSIEQLVFLHCRGGEQLVIGEYLSQRGGGMQHIGAQTKYHGKKRSACGTYLNLFFVNHTMCIVLVLFNLINKLFAEG